MDDYQQGYRDGQALASGRAERIEVAYRRGFEDGREQRTVGGLARQDAEHRERVRALGAAIKAFDAAPQRSSAALAALCARWMAAAREVARGFE